MKPAKPRDDYDKDSDARIVPKRPFMAAKRLFEYETEDKDEVARLSNCFHHIICTARQWAVEGIQKLCSVVGTLKPRAVQILSGRISGTN